MNVGELIKELERFNSNLEVKVMDNMKVYPFVPINGDVWKHEKTHYEHAEFVVIS